MTVTVTPQEPKGNRQIITAANQTFFSDLSADDGGEGTAPSPYDLLLGAWASCTNMTLQLYARRKGWPLENVSTQLSKTRKGSQTLFRKEIRLWGALTPQQVDALESVAEKCPVNQLIMGAKPAAKSIERSIVLIQ